MTKVVVRLLDANIRLLGWTEHQAVLRGDGTLWSQGPIQIMAELEGTAATVSVHWCEVNVEVRVPCVVVTVPGQMVTVYERAMPILTVGPMPGPLPAVTVRQAVAVAVPVGQLGARTR